MIRLNEIGLRQLLESPLGPVGRDLTRRAEQVTQLATENASGPVIGIESAALHSGIHFEIHEDARGLFATIATPAMSSWRGQPFSYPAYHDQRQNRPWLTKALAEGFR
jgi:hypothetical protein